jgi:hypothetical protein
VANDKPKQTRRNWVFQQQDAAKLREEQERGRAAGQGAASGIGAASATGFSVASSQGAAAGSARQEAADRIVNLVASRLEPVFANLPARPAAATMTLKEFLFGHKGKGIRATVEDCPRLSPNEKLSRWAVRLLPLATAVGVKASERTIAEYLARRYGQRK